MRYYSLLIFLLIPTALFAQEHHIVLDTVFVVEKSITHNVGVNVGTKVDQLPVELLEVNRSRNMSELLAENTTISVKSMGLGANATASFRGTSAAQTRVNWNGVNITPVMAGIFDFSQMPVFFADKVSLFHGSNDVKSGTGAVGGSVNIDNIPYWDGLWVNEVGGEYGSYNTYTAKASSRYGSSSFSGKTRIYYQHSNNDYAYLNKVSDMIPFMERRKDAKFDIGSAMQELHFKLWSSSFLTAILWYQLGERLLPQPLGVETTVHEKQKEQNIRALLAYSGYFGKHKLQAKSAYIQYGMRYDRWFDNNYFDPTGNANSSYTIDNSIDYIWELSRDLLLNSTLTYRHDLAVAESYREIDESKYIGTGYVPPAEVPPAREHRDILSWHNAVRYRPFEWLTSDLRLMIESVDWKRTVSTYSLGVSAVVIPNKLNVRSSISSNYRQPSLNELYWRPGGNPDVLPEQGHSYDLTIKYNSRLWRTPLTLTVEATGYIMDIDNWILWLPVDETVRGNVSQNQWLWRPQNKRDVRSNGVDLLLKLAFEKKKLRSSLSWTYSYTRSYTKTKQHEDDGSLLKQIPYIPKQKWSLRWTLDYANFSFNLQTNYIGVRYITTDQSYFAYPYNVTNAMMGYTFSIGKVRVQPSVRVDNLFNTYYESTKYYPMPRRTFLSSVQFIF